MVRTKWYVRSKLGLAAVVDIRGRTEPRAFLISDDEGKEHFIAATQFEADYARFALPCFDEPGMKVWCGVELLVLWVLIGTVSSAPSC